MLSGLPQMIVYLAAVQRARLAHHKINTSVFGTMTDSDEFKVHLSSLFDAIVRHKILCLDL